jgi:hypothetical protein
MFTLSLEVIIFHEQGKFIIMNSRAQIKITTPVTFHHLTISLIAYQRNGEWTSLQRWATSQRLSHSDGRLSDDHRAKLDALGFVFEMPPRKTIDGKKGIVGYVYMIITL